MIFSFQKFIEDLRKDEDKKKIIIKYEKYFGEIVGEIKDQFW